MRIYLNFGAGTSHHSLYKELLEYPPPGVEYFKHGINVERIPKPILSAYGFIKKFAGHFTSSFFRKTINSTAPKADLIHFCDHIEFSKKAFVSDLEHAWSLLPAGSVKGALTKELFDENRHSVQKMIKQDSCKMLLPWTRKGLLSVINAYDFPGLEDKMHVIPLARHIPVQHTPLEHNGFNLLFLGTSNLKGDWNFYYRGGVRLLRVFQKFSKGKNDVKLIITGEIPDSEKWRLKNLPIQFGFFPKAELENIFRTSDVFFYPSYCTPGLAFLEAKAYHLPIITTNSWANPEIVNDSNGIICNFSNFKKEGPYGITPVEQDYTPFEKKDIDSELEDQMIEALEKLYSDKSLRKSLGENGFQEVSEGKFSINKRNEALLNAYTQALQ